MRPVFQPSPEDWPYLRRLAWTIVAAATVVVLWRAAHLLLLVFGSILASVMYRSAARLLQRFGLRNEKIALAIGILFVLACFTLMGWLLGVQFGGEIGQIIGNLPGTLQKIEQGMDKSPVGHAIVQAVQAATGGGMIAHRLGSLMLGSGQILINGIIVLVGGMFIAGNPRPYLHAIVLLTPPKGRRAMEHAIDEVSTALRLWLKEKLLATTSMTVVISLALWAAGLHSWAALGLLGGLGEFVPYVGPTLAMIPAIALAAVQGNPVLWRTIVAYVIIRLIEAYLLTPVLNRKVISIPPALTLFVILGVAAVFGLYGAFFAGALLVTTFVAVRELYLRDTLGEDLEGLPKETKD